MLQEQTLMFNGSNAYFRRHAVLARTFSYRTAQIDV